MGVSHIALVVKNMAATHRFYTEAMAFDLVKVEIIPKTEGFARHVFYSTGSATDQLIAFWDFAAMPGAAELRTDICRDLGLDPLTNHIAFQADDLDDIAIRKQRWLDFGVDVIEIDHGWIHSIYAEDPDGISVEFAVVTRPFTDADAAEAQELLVATAPPPSPDEPIISFHQADPSR
jgi:catechol 2,3-dioxygenase-like lactoylglutathione lyase family enzyme